MDPNLSFFFLGAGNAIDDWKVGAGSINGDVNGVADGQVWLLLELDHHGIPIDRA